jgi:hypothetical protein
MGSLFERERLLENAPASLAGYGWEELTSFPARLASN